MFVNGQPQGSVSRAVEDGYIRAIRIVVNPDKLRNERMVDAAGRVERFRRLYSLTENIPQEQIPSHGLTEAQGLLLPIRLLLWRRKGR